MANWYATLSAVRSAGSLPVTLTDAQISSVIEALSRSFDAQWRPFYASVQTRLFTPTSSNVLHLRSDLLSVSALAVDLDYDRVYESTLDATEYDLLPTEAPQDSPPAPYWQIAIRPLLGRFFPAWPLSTQVTGLWGYYHGSDLATATAKTGGTQAANVTNLEVSSSTEFSVGNTLFVGSEPEQMFVSAVGDSTHVTVTRGVNGTTAATVAASAPLRIATYPIVSEAIQAAISFWLQARSAPGGVLGTPDLGSIRLGQSNPQVQKMMDPFRRRGVA